MQGEVLVDSGSSFLILPYSSSDVETGPAIMAADRSKIRCWGSVRRTLYVAGRQYTRVFLRAAVAFPILGADFLAAFDLMVDLKR